MPRAGELYAAEGPAPSLPVTRGQKDLPDQLAPQGPLEPQELPVIREQRGPLALPAPPAI